MTTITFEMNMESDSDAFRSYPESEVTRLLRETAVSIEQGYTEGGLLDSNGNHVGRWELDADEH